MMYTKSLLWEFIAFLAFIRCIRCLHSELWGHDDQPESRLVKVDISITNMKSKRSIEKHIIMKITDASDEPIMTLNFREIHDKLADQQTPIWYSWHGLHTMPNFDHDYKTMAEVGRFKRYHDYENKAGMIWFTDTRIVEAIVGAKYIVRNLPDFAMKFPVSSKGREQVFKRSIDRNSKLDEDDVNLVEFIKSQRFYMTKREAETTLPRALPRNYTANTSELDKDLIPDVAYPQILVVLDHSSVKNKRRRTIVMSVLIYWNIVDMLFSPLTKPAVKLSIAGIVIPSDSHTTPYLDRSIDSKGRLDAEIALKFTENFFHQLQPIFSTESYDFLFVMTTAQLCGRVEGYMHCGLGGLAPYHAPDCGHKVQLQRVETADGRVHNIGFITTVAIIEHRDFYNSFVTAAHELAHLFSAVHDDSENCSSGIMSAGMRPEKPSFHWSQCTLDQFKIYFRSNLSSCLYNKP